MKATGLFFLRMHASTGADAKGQRVAVLLPVTERDPDDHRIVLNQLLVHWSGDEALAFFDAHQAELRAGRGLFLEIDRLHGADGQWKARATHCALAPLPPSWCKDDPQPQTQAATA